MNSSNPLSPSIDFKEHRDFISHFLAASALPCIYCGLPAADMTKCSHGFPGCGRADDMMLDPFGEKYGVIKDNPDRFCVTDESGDCISEDPRCMHQPHYSQTGNRKKEIGS